MVSSFIDAPPRFARIAPARILIIAALVAGALALGIAAFPWGLLHATIERKIAGSLGRPVSIGRLERVDTVSFTPRLRVEQLRVPQAAWAGRGDAIHIRRMTIDLPLWPLLTGRLQPRHVDIEGLRLDLVRDRNGRESWRSTAPSAGSGGGQRFGLLTIRDARLRYRDARRDRMADVSIRADRAGLRIDGRGTILGAPVALAASGAPISGDAPWPFRASITGDALRMTMTGRMDHPLDIGHLDATVSARAHNLRYVDAVIEAGLPRTQPVTLSAKARRDGPDWRVSGLRGTVGRSDIAGDVTITKRDGRHHIDAILTARRFDFDDLADAEGRARAAAKRQRFGLRIFPDTAIDLDNVARTDGVLRVSIGQLLWPGPSPFRSLRGEIRVDRQRLTFAPLRIGLTHGAITGHAMVDQRSGRPILSTDLHLRGGRVMDFAPDTGIDGNLEGVMRLSGPGRTIRAAIGASGGRIALVGRNGSLPARTASLLGQDLLKGLFTGKDEQAVLRCAIIRLDARRGIATANPILIDTSRAQTLMTGHINLADERLALKLTGTPKQNSALRLRDPIDIGGTIKAPVVDLPGGGPVGAVLKAIGRSFGGGDDDVATDAHCGALAAKALAAG